jgi:hypothetical protein
MLPPRHLATATKRGLPVPWQQIIEAMNGMVSEVPMVRILFAAAGKCFLKIKISNAIPLM